MFEVREEEKLKKAEDSAPIPFVDEQLNASSPEDERNRRHAVLMECLEDERDRQSEERQQAAIDEDFYDHLQWRREDAAELIARGQAPLVFNQSRQTIDWMVGTEKRMRKDWKILGRERGDDEKAQVITQVVKYTDDANFTAWHHSKAFKQAVLSGLGWMEEGVNVDPGEEIIYSGSEDWRNVFRDSRARGFDLKEHRYQFRRKVTDLDFAIALMPQSRDHLRQVASHDETVDENDIWYLGERLTGASDLDLGDGLPAGWRDRRAYIGADRVDRGRRTAVELLECWYRVPETVDVFDAGPLAGKLFNGAMEGHQQLKRDGHRMYQTVKMRMRVMIATKDRPLWDGPSPFEHGSFLLVPVWGYRRFRDGACYGAMRGMRDIQEDTNKRGSKALWLLSSNRVVADQNAVEDVEDARSEAARADGWIEVKTGKKLEFVKPQAEINGNLEMMDRNVQFMRDVGGVTNANLGRGASGQSGISVERQQDQGSLTTSELFDMLLLAKKMAGQLRLSHIKQFKTAADFIRVTGEGQPIDWLPVNQPDPATGQIMNDLASINCDYIVSEQDYRESYVRAATAEMFELLGKIGTFAPQMVLAVLDLVVEGSELRYKDEWVARVRKLNGQRDPTKKLTPEEAKAQQAQQEQEKEAQDVQRAMLKAQLAKLMAEVDKLDTDTMAKRVDSLFAALQAAQVVALTPGVAPIGDALVAEAGFKPVPGGVDPNIPQPAQPVPGVQPVPQSASEPMQAEPQQLEGVHSGIQTPTGADNGPLM